MKILLDNIIFSLQKAGGVSVYWSELLIRFSRSKACDVSWIEMLSAENNKMRKSLDMTQNQLFEEKNLYINRILKVNNSFVNGKHIFHSSYYRLPLKSKECCQITTIHDFMPELFGKNYKAKLIAKMKYNSIKYSDGVICVSENTKSDLLKMYPEFSKKEIAVIHNGAGNDFYPITEQDSTVLTGIARPFCIFIGKRDWYKNFKFAVNYIAQTKDLNIVIVGGGQLATDEIKLLEANIKGRYKFINYAPNTDLNTLYNHAEFLFYPSDYEGFGIPVVEAQKAGCPFIAQRSSSIVELVNNKDLLIDELTVTAIDKMRHRIERERSQIIKEGVENAKRFSWEKSHAVHLDFYKYIYSKRFN